MPFRTFKQVDSPVWPRTWGGVVPGVQAGSEEDMDDVLKILAAWLARFQQGLVIEVLLLL